MSPSQFLIQAEVYFNIVKSHVEFRLPKDTAYLAVKRSKLNDFLLDAENRKVGKIKFRADWTDTVEKVKYDLLK